jgi:hypothetical protein
MTDPTGYLTAKIAAAIGGFFGGAGILTFIKPKTIREAFMRGGVSVGAAIIFSDPFIKYFDLARDWEMQMMVGACVGFLAYSVLGMIANFLIMHKESNIFEVMDTLKKKNTPAKKTTRRKK